MIRPNLSIQPLVYPPLGNSTMTRWFLGGIHPCRKGFTLVEMLLVIMLFGMTLSVLVVGLRSGVQAWKTVKTHQEAQAPLERALNIMRDDFLNLLAPSEDRVAFKEEMTENGLETIHLSRCGGRLEQRAGVGCPWLSVNYEVRNSEDTDEPELVRITIPYAGAKPFDEEENVEVMLPGIKEVTYSYLTRGGQPADSWSDTQSVPQAVVVTIERDKGGTIQETFIVPLGFFSGESQ